MADAFRRRRRRAVGEDAISSGPLKAKKDTLSERATALTLGRETFRPNIPLSAEFTPYESSQSQEPLSLNEILKLKEIYFSCTKMYFRKECERFGERAFLTRLAPTAWDIKS